MISAILTNSRTHKARESSTCWPQVQSHSWAFTGDVIGEEELSWGQHQAANCYSVGSVAFGKAERNITHVIVKNVFLGILFPLWVGWSVFWDNSTSVPHEEQKQVRWSCTFHRCYLYCSSMGKKKKLWVLACRFHIDRPHLWIWRKIFAKCRWKW